jgi:hypothetical protein
LFPTKLKTNIWKKNGEINLGIKRCEKCVEINLGTFYRIEKLEISKKLLGK